MSTSASGADNGPRGPVPARDKRPAVQPSGRARRPAKHHGKAARPPRASTPSPGAWRVNAESAISITVYDMSGAPLNPYVVYQLEALADKIAQQEKLTVNVQKG